MAIHVPPLLDGSRPGRYYINLKSTADWPKFSLPTLTYHEALPGHQWQFAIAQESKDIPMLRRLTIGPAAYVEGWALYAEALAEELGVYDGDALGRIGYLQSMLFRSVRLVVDTGIHAEHWSRERATDYMVSATALPRRAPRAKSTVTASGRDRLAATRSGSPNGYACVPLPRSARARASI